MKAIIDGGTSAHGSVRVSGAKNSATRLLSAALLTDEPVELSRFPTELVDVRHKVQFIASLGGRVELDESSDVARIDASKFQYRDLEHHRCPIRTTYLLAAGQILRSGVARIPYPGGCQIGSRGYDIHVMVWERLGCEVRELPSCIEITGDAFRGAEIHFPISTVGGTENALLCGSIARGVTELFNAYITPEVEDLIDLLRRMGADIEVAGNSHIRIAGSRQLSGARMRVMPDRIEALTWIVYAVLSKSSILIEDVPFDAMRSDLLYLESAGIDALASSTSLYVHPHCVREGHVRPFEIPCGSHPGVISDMQPFYVALALCASGVSRVFDYRYPERIAYVRELAKFCSPGALRAEIGKITVQGPSSFVPAQAVSTDLRGSMALIIAALCASGRSTIHDAHISLRGYNDLPRKLTRLGVDGFDLVGDHPAVSAREL